MNDQEFKESMLEFQADVMSRFEKMDQRFDRMEKKMEGMKRTMEEGFDDVKTLLAGLSATVVTVPKLRRELRDKIDREVP